MTFKSESKRIVNRTGKDGLHSKYKVIYELEYTKKLVG